MKIASVTFFAEVSSTGGGQTPAIAFKEWCDEFNVPCDLVGISDKNPSMLIQLDKVITPNEIDQLNDYDAIFFQTPPLGPQIDLDKIKTRFIGMLHGEGDLELYCEQKVKELFGHQYCVGLAHIDPDENLYSGYHENNFFWHPCARPKYLSMKNFYKYRTRKFSMLYASRISMRKNPILFNEMANGSLNITGGASMYGIAHKEEFGLTVDKTIGAVARHKFVFNPSNVFANRNYGLYWEVIGNPYDRLTSKRVSLSCIEAINYGIMPILSLDSAPDNMINEGHFLFVNTYHPDQEHFRNQLLQFMENRDKRMETVRDYMMASRFSYGAIHDQVLSIVNSLLEK